MEIAHILKLESTNILYIKEVGKLNILNLQYTVGI